MEIHAMSLCDTSKVRGVTKRKKNFRGERILLFVESDKGLLVESSNGYRLQQIINDYKVVIFYPLVDAPIRSTVVLDQKLIVLQRTLSSQL